ncbi:peptidoglycan DD-metalloendopeptidase family protein, partial [Halorhodospira neutriphila]
LNAGPPAERLASLHPGQRLTLTKDAEGALQGLRFPFSPEQALRIEADGDGFQAAVVSRQSQRQLVKTEAEIERSLYRAAQRAGLNARLTMQLTRILGWEVDLGRDLRAGDSFTVIFERIETEDETVLGDIKAVRLDSDRAGTIEAVRYSHGDGQADYYTPQGESLRREFKRYPVNYRRVSSSFDRNRRHPILGVRRPHLGVDLAASRGTPVRAAGEGRVVERRYKGGYGRLVTLEHGSRYRTRYAHLARYARGLSPGDRVERGEVIGYVGSSGLSTGPHLHYEFLVNGRHRNPVTVELPKADPLPAQYRQAFRSHAEPLLSALEGNPDDGELRIALLEPEQ